jgi:NADH-quinone oxidoreductase subunit N
MSAVLLARIALFGQTEPIEPVGGGFPGEFTGDPFGGAGPEAVEGIVTPLITWSALVPLIVLGLGAILLLTVSSLSRGRMGHRLSTAWTVVVGLAAAATALPLWARVQDWGALWWWDPADQLAGAYSTGAGAVGIDGFSVFVTVLIGVAVALVAPLVGDWSRREGMRAHEMHSLLLLSAAGGVVMAVANDLIVLFLGLETLSIAAYVLAAMNLRRAQSQEAGLKYFVMGAFSSAFFLYGIAMVYGATGSTSLLDISDFLAGSLLIGTESGLLLVGLALLLVGFGFKIAAVPFHFWSPDVYQGSPTPVVAFMASVVKIAAFAGIVRVMVLTFGGLAGDWRPIVDALALLSLVIGAAAAIVQTDVKRMLAYSSINHAGFILLAVQAVSADGNEAILLYLTAYAFMVIGTFGVAAVVSRRGDRHTTLADYQGLGRTNPFLAGLMTLFLLAQAGIPFTAGFYAKFWAVIAAVDSGAAWLGVVAMLSAVVAAFLYLRLVGTMWFTSGEPSTPRLELPAGTGVVLILCAVATLAIGIFPDAITGVAADGQPALVRPEVAEADPSAGIDFGGTILPPGAGG